MPNEKEIRTDEINRAVAYMDSCGVSRDNVFHRYAKQRIEAIGVDYAEPQEEALVLEEGTVGDPKEQDAGATGDSASMTEGSIDQTGS